MEIVKQLAEARAEIDNNNRTMQMTMEAFSKANEYWSKQTGKKLASPGFAEMIDFLLAEIERVKAGAKKYKDKRDELAAAIIEDAKKQIETKKLLARCREVIEPFAKFGENNFCTASGKLNLACGFSNYLGKDFVVDDFRKSKQLLDDLLTSESDNNE